MNTAISTIQHEFCVYGLGAVLAATGGVPAVKALEAATDRLDAAIAGLRALMCDPNCSDTATLSFYAAESALALVFAAHAGLEAAEAEGDQA